MIALVQKHGFIHAVDFMLIKLLDLIDGCYTANPLIALHPQPVHGVLHAEDSDIQNDVSYIAGGPTTKRKPSSRL